jgi:aspartate kinase
MTGGQAGIVTDDEHGSARIIEVDPRDVLHLVEQGRVPVVCGFQGRSKPTDGSFYGEITTLGRGGSDTTASALGAALHAEAIEIYTDVDGVKTADPSYVDFAPTLRKMTYAEVAEIAHQGAKVLHPRAAEIAMRYEIPLWVKSTFTDEIGTEIVGPDNFGGRRVTGVTHTGKLVYLHFDFTSPEAKRALEVNVYRLMADNRINLFMVNTHEDSFGFSIPRKQLLKVKEILDGLVVPVEDAIYLVQVGKAQTTEVTSQEAMLREASGTRELRKCIVSLTENVTMVSLIAYDYLAQPGIYLRVLQAMHDNAIPVIQCGDSPLSITLLVSEADTERAVQALHTEFELTAAI